MPGTKIPLCGFPNGLIHKPPASGEPCTPPNIKIAGSLLQTLMTPSRPAEGLPSISMSVPLSLPVATGVSETTRMRYSNPVGVFNGTTDVIEPAFTDANVPMEIGAAKLPKASLSSAVKMFPAVKLPVIV